VAGNGGLHVWDLPTATERWGVKNLNFTPALGFSRDGTLLLTAEDEGGNPLSVRQTATGHEVHAFKTEGRIVNHLKFVLGEPRLVTVGAVDLRLWDIGSARSLQSVSGVFPAPGALHISDDNKTIVTMVSGELVFQNMDGTERDRLKVNPCAVLCVFGLSGDATRVVVPSGGSDVAVYDVPSHQRLRVLSIRDETPKGGPFPTPPSFFVLAGLALSSNGRVLATSAVTGAQEQDVVLWDLDTGHRLAMLRSSLPMATSMAFTSDGKTIAVGGANGQIEIWDAQDDERLRVLASHEDAITAIAINADGSLLASASLDGTVRLWRLNTGEELGSLVAIGDDGYVVAIPDGRYTASKSVVDGVAFRVGRNAYPFEQFDAVLNRPDVVVKKIGLSSPQLVQAYERATALRVRTLGGALEDAPPSLRELPVLHVTGLPPPAVDKKKIAFTIRGTSIAPIRSVRVLVNDVPVDVGGGVETSEPSNAIERKIDIELGGGSNKIQVTALDARGLRSPATTFYVTYTGPTAKPELYVLAVGVTKYRQIGELEYAAKDARDVGHYFSDHSPSAHVLVLPDEEATRTNVLKAKSFLSTARVDDHVIVFIAGHGILDEKGDYFFAPYDMDFSAPSTHGVSFADLEALLSDITARHKLLLIDSCHAGLRDDAIAVLPATAAPDPTVSNTAVRGLRPGSKTDPTIAVVERLFVDVRRGSGAAIIAASQGGETSGMGAQNGLFTAVVLDVLKEHPAATVNLLRDEVTERVSRLSKGLQTPSTRREPLEFDFKVIP
jgi:WD40 repeat protein